MTRSAAGPRVRRRAEDLGRSLEGALVFDRPRSYEELRAVLSSASVKLPRQLRQAATYILHNPSEVAVGNTIDISRRAGVQPSTLVRFAQSLGYPGFGELQELFKSYVKVNWSETGERPALLPDASIEDDPDLRLVGGLARSAMTSLARLAESLDRFAFDRLAACLAEAETIYLVGSKRAFPVTTYMSLAFAQLGIRNMLVDNIGSTAFEQLGFAGRGDAVLAISFSPYNSITPALAAKAAQAGATTLTITDSPFSPLVPVSAASLVIAEPDYGGFRSLAATMAAGLSLVLSVARRRQALPPAASGRAATGSARKRNVPVQEN